VIAPNVRKQDFVKRSMDVVLAGLMLVVLLPLMLVIAAIVRLTSRGPVLFHQARVGDRKQPFVMLKFRTMYHECDDTMHREYVTRMLNGDHASSETGPVIHKLTDDPRITEVGRVLRRTSLDELPQLINVLRGEMSLVGPRPVLPWEAELLGSEYEARFAVKPGITGLWQVKGRNRLTMLEAGDLDVEYAQHRGLWLDLRILVMTIPTVAWAALTGRGSR
jgi:lipopolysaccharide/colanic/teichoic acid biosynthesis glycosyltransferase